MQRPVLRLGTEASNEVTAGFRCESGRPFLRTFKLWSQFFKGIRVPKMLLRFQRQVVGFGTDKNKCIEVRIAFRYSANGLLQAKNFDSPFKEGGSA